METEGCFLAGVPDTKPCIACSPKYTYLSALSHIESHIIQDLLRVVAKDSANHATRVKGVFVDVCGLLFPLLTHAGTSES